MDTDVYLLCPVCKTITEGKGSGDLTDLIKCQSCLNSFIAKSSIKYQKYNINEDGFITFNEKPLFIPVDIEIR